MIAEALEISGETAAQLVVGSPVGQLRLRARGGALTGLYMATQRPPELDPVPPDPANAAVLERAAAQLEEYFAGRRTVFDLPLAPIGTPFQLAVWAALRRIPHGVTWSYRQLAAEIDPPGVARAVGGANAKNPIGIIVPCHRVIGSSGALTGYAGGLDAKQWLLAHEGALLLAS